MMNKINFLELKQILNFRKEKIISINARFYMVVHYYHHNTITLYDNEIAGYYKAVAEIWYIEDNKVLVFLADNGIITSKNRLNYNLTDTVDKLALKLPLELIAALNSNMDLRRKLCKLINKIN